jgi:pimeloyl-ACP methyl ester carboxylesterase
MIQYSAMKKVYRQAGSVRNISGTPIYRGQLPAESFPVKTVTYANEAEEMWGSQGAIHLVVAHGAWGGPRTMGPLLRHALRTAKVIGRKTATATMYQDPQLGFKGYAAADRAERFERVVKMVSDRFDQPVHLMGHSWSGQEAIEVAHRAAREEQAASFIAYTLSNRIEDGSMSLGSFLERSFREARYGKTVAGVQSLVAIGSVGLSAVLHSAPALPKAVAECIRALHTRPTSKLIALSDMLPTGVSLAEHDAFFGAGEAAGRHLREAGFKGPIGIMMDTTHMSAVSNFRNGEALYDIVDAVLCPSSPTAVEYYE